MLSSRFADSSPRVTSAAGAWLQTDDGPMLDYLLGNCTQILGHRHPHVIDRVKAQLDVAVNVGDHLTELAESVAERILRITGMDALRFVNTGSEAIHCALRVGRAYTERPVFVRFEGHYHGWFAEEIARFLPAPDYGRGLAPGTGDQLVTLPWNDASAFEALMARDGERVAAVICEPLLCHSGPIPPLPGYLELLRESTSRHGSLLIFDECITGFRLGLRGAQEHYKVDADLVAYSKAISAGFPLGVCAGRADVMQPLTRGDVYQAGTYDANPISMAAAAATLDVLEGGDVHERMRAHGRGVQDLVAEALRRADVPAVCQGEPVVFQFFLTDGRVIDRSQAFATDVALWSLVVDELQKRGVNVSKGDLRDDPEASWLAPWFVSAAHGERELAWLEAAFGPALDAALMRRRSR